MSQLLLFILNKQQQIWLDPCKISQCFPWELNTKTVAALNYFVTQVKSCLSYFYSKALWLTYFLIYFKDIANLLLGILLKCLIMLITNDSITLYQLLRNFDVYLHAKNQCHLAIYAPNLQFLELWDCLMYPMKNHSIHV